MAIFPTKGALLNKSNIWPARGSDHSPSVKIATFRGPAKVQHHQLEGFNALINRGSLTFSVDETALHSWYCEAKPSLRGRPPHYSDMAITSVLMLKRIFGLILRALQRFVDSIVTLIKVPLNCPDDTCISKRAKSGHVPFKTPTPGKIAHLVIDSTGLNVLGQGEWKVKNTVRKNGGSGENCIWP